MRCCNSCGILACNKDQVKVSSDGTSWYSQENMDRLWENARTMGRFLICHSTDPTASEYEGESGIHKGKETACLGYTVWVFIHIKLFEHASSLTKGDPYARYVKLVGKDQAMSVRAMGEMAFDMVAGKTGFGFGMLIPRSIEESRNLRFPTGFYKTVELYNSIFPTLQCTNHAETVIQE
jgi:hypothetical protein